MDERIKCKATTKLPETQPKPPICPVCSKEKLRVRKLVFENTIYCPNCRGYDFYVQLINDEYVATPMLRKGAF